MPQAEGTRAGPLVGRRQELARLEAALDGMRSPGARWLAVSGEPGTGKTRLLAELAPRAQAREHLVLVGRGAELERELPFGIWVAALDDHVAALGPTGWRRSSAIAPPSSPGCCRRPPEAATWRSAGFRTSASAPTGRSAPCSPGWRRAQPVVLVLDDVHWADEASLELIVHLLRRPAPARILIALAFREGQLPASLLAALEAATRESSVRELRLTPLSAEEADALMGEQLPAAVRAEVFRQSGGNPFYLQELRARLATARAATVRRGRGRRARLGVRRARAGDRGLGDSRAGWPGERRSRVIRRTSISPPWRRGSARAGARGAGGAGGARRAARDRGAAAIRASAIRSCAAPSMRPRARPGGSAHMRAPPTRSRGGPARSRHAPTTSNAPRAWATRPPRRSSSRRPTRRGAGAGGRRALAGGGVAGVARSARARTPVAGWACWSRSPARRRRPGASRRRSRRCWRRWRRSRREHPSCASGSSPPARFARTRSGATPRPTRACCTRSRSSPSDGTAGAAALQVELAADALYDSDFGAMRRWAGGRRGRRRRSTTPACSRSPRRSCASPSTPSAGPGKRSRPRRERRRSRRAPRRAARRPARPAVLPRLRRVLLRALRGRGAALPARHRARARLGQGQFVVPMMVGLAQALERLGRLREALSTAEAAVEAGRLTGNRQAVGFALVAEAWTAAELGDVEHARAAAEEAVALLDALDESVLTRATHAHVGVIWLEIGEPDRCIEQLRAAGLPGLPADRARAARLALHRPGPRRARGRRPRGGRQVARPRRGDGPRPRPAARRRMGAARPRAAHARRRRRGRGRRAGAAGRRAGGGGARAGPGRTLPNARRHRAGAGRRARAGAIRLLTAAQRELAACEANRYRDEAARAAPPPRPPRRRAPAPRRARTGPRRAQRPRARDRRPRRARTHQPPDRRRAVPLPEDGRGPPHQRVRQARRVLARRGGRSRRPRPRIAV